MRFLFAEKTAVDFSRSLLAETFTTEDLGRAPSPFTLQAGVRAMGDRRERSHTLSIEGLNQPRRPFANLEADQIAF